MIFVVEDDHGVRELELYALRQSGYEAEGFETPAAFRQALYGVMVVCDFCTVYYKSRVFCKAGRFYGRAVAAIRRTAAFVLQDQRIP